MRQAVFAEQRRGEAAVFDHQYFYAGPPAPPQSGGGKNRRVQAMRERERAEQQILTNQIIQAIVAMVVSGALDE